MKNTLNIEFRDQPKDMISDYKNTKFQLGILYMYNINQICNKIKLLISI